MNLVTDTKRDMKDLREQKKNKNDKKVLLVEKLTSDIDKNEKYFESDSFVVSLNKARSVSDLSALRLEYNDEGEFFFCAKCFGFIESDRVKISLTIAGYSELQAGVLKYEKVLGLEFEEDMQVLKYKDDYLEAYWER